MSSVSSAGSRKIIMQFALTRNIDLGAQDVQSALLQVARRLPSQMPDPPTIRKMNPAD
ncbi:efflux RND transporter permease subunit [Coxiella endosymbiont of Ornithodoros maritimus]|uniref:efflux RND transporter permease subunit n=1 Tax=Coxiella endosymbiont of Ornithodoros maritimus TaxID=1656172 RepID=UPI0022643D56|nr:efflux RND transporter permease subunit [Coxiella endosymbiont of Ornithodoros maritimus]